MKFYFLLAILSMSVLFAHASSPTIDKIEWVLGSESEFPQSFHEFSDSYKIPFRSSYWVKVNITVPREDDYVLSAGNLYMRNMLFYGDHFERLSLGNYHEMHLKKGSYVLYIYFPFEDFQNEHFISLKFNKSSVYFKNRLSQAVYHRVFVAVLLFLCLLSISFFFIRKTVDWLYFHYAWYLFSIIYFFSYQYGILGEYWPAFNNVPPYFIWISSASLSLSYIYFAQTYLDMRNTDPTLFKIVRFGKYFIVIVVIVEVIGYFINYDIQHNVYYKSIVLLVQATLIPIIIVRIYRLKTILSWILFFGVIVLGITTLGGQVAAVIKWTDRTNILVQIALLLEVFIFSIGIGIRMWVIEEEKRKTQFSLLKQMKQNVAIQQEYTFELENKVKERTLDLQNKNEEKDLLLKEIHHRVKNNLQTIASLLSIQLRRLKSEPAKLAIEDSMNRVNVMGLIHKFLYQEHTYTSIKLNEYVRQLLNMIIDASNVKKKITLIVDVDEITLDIDRAISIGLILNELVINSAKHAFVNLEDPVIRLTAKKNDRRVDIAFSDNGKMETVNVLRGSQGFGWKLINSLVTSLDGELEYSINKGFVVKIRFPYKPID